MWQPGLEMIARERMEDLRRAAERQQLVRQAQQARPQRLRQAFSGMLTGSGRGLIRLGEKLVEPGYMRGAPSDLPTRR